MNDSFSPTNKKTIVRNFTRSGTPQQRPTFRSWEAARGATASEQGSATKAAPNRQHSFARSRDFRAILAFGLAAIIAAATYFILKVS